MAKTKKQSVRTGGKRRAPSGRAQQAKPPAARSRKPTKKAPKVEKKPPAELPVPTATFFF